MREQGEINRRRAAEGGEMDVRVGVSWPVFLVVDIDARES